MSRTFACCNSCGDDIGPGVDPPSLCGECAKHYPWAYDECQNAWHAGYAAGRNDAQRETERWELNR
jgi:hypothetical protein